MHSTGTGKTYTLGSSFDSANGTEADTSGIIPRSIHLIFDLLDMLPREKCRITVSHLEIYNEELFDLLPGALSKRSSSKFKSKIRSISKVMNTQFYIQIQKHISDVRNFKLIYFLNYFSDRRKREKQSI